MELDLSEDDVAAVTSSAFFRGVEGGERIKAAEVEVAATVEADAATIGAAVMDVVIEEAVEETEALLLERRSLLAGPL